MTSSIRRWVPALLTTIAIVVAVLTIVAMRWDFQRHLAEREALVATQHDLERRLAEYETLGTIDREELEPYQLKYGPHRSSRFYEEWLIRDFFKDRRGGFFLDVGANDYKRESNTYYLETVLGWSGIAIDALPEFGAGYAAHRQRTRFLAVFVSDVPDSKVQFFVPKKNTLIASSNRDVAAQAGAVTSREVPTTTLDVVLKHAGVTAVDFLSMDIELSEPKALAGFDIRRFQPKLVCIEAHAEVRQQIVDYFIRNGYTVIGRYLKVDPYNLYFMPLVNSGARR